MTPTSIWYGIFKKIVVCCKLRKMCDLSCSYFAAILIKVLKHCVIVLNVHENSTVATLTKHLTSKSKTKKYSMTTNTGELYFYLHQAPNVTWVSSNLSPTFIWAQDVEIKTEMHITILLATIKHFYILLFGKINNQIRTMQIEWSKKAIFPINFCF